MFSAMVKKEFLLVLRDKQALLALFIMPAIFILIMSVAMRDIFSQDAVSFDIAVLDLDKSKIRNPNHPEYCTSPCALSIVHGHTAACRLFDPAHLQSQYPIPFR